jgi:hypothetical protein
MKRLVTLTLFFIFSGVLLAETLATVGNYTITDKDVKDFIADMKKRGFSTKNITEDYALNRLIDFRIGIMDAKNQMIDQDNDAKDAMEIALYAYYMEKNVDNKYKNKTFSNAETMAYYQKNPLVKIQRITYSFNKQVPGDTEKAYTQMNLLRSELKSKKITFEAALEKTQDKAIPALTGTFDKIIVNDLPFQETIEVKPLKLMEISSVIQIGKIFEIMRIVKIYPYSPEYADDINERMKQETIINARDKFAKVLRQKYSTLIQVNK